jgi:hypothetical protein
MSDDMKNSLMTGTGTSGVEKTVGRNAVSSNSSSAKDISQNPGTGKGSAGGILGIIGERVAGKSRK